MGQDSLLWILRGDFNPELSSNPLILPNGFDKLLSHTPDIAPVVVEFVLSDCLKICRE